MSWFLCIFPPSLRHSRVRKLGNMRLKPMEIIASSLKHLQVILMHGTSQSILLGLLTNDRIEEVRGGDNGGTLYKPMVRKMLYPDFAPDVSAGVKLPFRAGAVG